MSKKPSERDTSPTPPASAETDRQQAPQPAAGEPTTTRLFLDRIEGRTAVLLLGEESRRSVELPTSCLPPGAKEGSWLRMDLRLDPEASQQAAAEVEALMQELLGERPAGEEAGPGAGGGNN